MPYIKQGARIRLRETQTPLNVGELNYMITRLCTKFITDMEVADNRSNGVIYSVINDVLGALEGAKLEFYRRVAVPYEKQKRKENGDVYDA